MSRIVKSEPLHIQAYNVMKNLFLNGHFEPGERITEMQFADKLGISRGPLREAIRMLSHDGLLIQDQRSIYLYKPTLEDIIDVFQCREYLESLAVRLATSNMTNEIEQTLATNIENLKIATKQKSVNDISSYDQQFHDLIIETSQNKQLINLMKKIQIKITYIRNNIFQHYHTRLNFLDEHVNIFKAMVERDTHKAEKEMKLHIQKNLQYIIEINKETNDF